MKTSTVVLVVVGVAVAWIVVPKVYAMITAPTPAPQGNKNNAYPNAGPALRAVVDPTLTGSPTNVLVGDLFANLFGAAGSASGPTFGNAVR